MATAPTFTPAEVAMGQEFFASNPTANQIYGRASEIGFSPEQVAGLYQQSMGGDFTGLLGGVTDYLGGTGQTLGGGYTSGLYAPELTQFTPTQIIDVAQSRTPEGGDVRQTLFDYGTEGGYNFDQMDQMLGLAPGSTAAYSNSLNPVTPVTPVKTPTIDGIVNEIAGTSAAPATINAPQAMGTYDTSDYFDRYFPVSITGGGTNQTTKLSNVTGQSSLADILTNIQGQYTPQQFTQSGGSYGAGRFLPADMVPGMVNTAGGTGFTPTEVSKATEYFSQVTDPQQIFERADEIGLSGTQLADLFSKSTGANYNDVLQSINNWSEATGNSLDGGYTPGSSPWFEPASFEQYSQSLIDKSLDQAVAETMGVSGGSSGDIEAGAPSAWSNMTEQERGAWVQANPGKYVAGKMAAVALLPGGQLLAIQQDPYMGMSLVEYGVGKASNIAMGGLLDEGKGAPVVTSSGNTVSNEAAMEAALQSDREYYD
jgi:hypothetical protein